MKSLLAQQLPFQLILMLKALQTLSRYHLAKAFALGSIESLICRRKVVRDIF
ncbi:hypothetical protein [Brevibacillus porteri]|uniref:hypothetical protein n=1 Tax=Brevibacillus porteri TaxID=2126350 RepID=UPI003D1C1EAC